MPLLPQGRQVSNSKVVVVYATVPRCKEETVPDDVEHDVECGNVCDDGWMRDGFGVG